MAKPKQPPADDITLRDVINRMNHKFGLIEGKLGALEGKMVLMDGKIDTLQQRMEQGFAEAKRERAEILRRVEAEAAAADDTLEKVVALTERVDIIEKHLSLPRRA